MTGLYFMIGAVIVLGIIWAIGCYLFEQEMKEPPKMDGKPTPEREVWWEQNFLIWGLLIAIAVVLWFGMKG